MKIAVNCQTMVKDKMEGLGWFTYETLRRITIEHPEHDFTFIFGKGIEPDYIFAENVKAVNIGPPLFRPLTWTLKFCWSLPRYINKNHFDLYVSTDGWSCSRIKIPAIIVVHDINFVHFPQFLQKSFYWFYTYFFKRWVKHATRIATVSNYSKTDIHKTYHKPINEIDVVYNGASPVYQPISTTEIMATRQTYSNGCPYFIFVGALHPRKNVKNLLLAYDQFKTKHHSDIKLLIVGEKFYWNKDTETAFKGMQFKDEVIFVGRLTQDKLRFVLGASLALAYVSLFEGFGIPIVEAMNCDIPIITSNTTSMPEIAGDAALIVDPNSIDQIAEAMHSITSKAELRQQLIEAGRVRRTTFSWEITAQGLWSTIEKAIHQTKA